jgi:hypothetical protein
MVIVANRARKAKGDRKMTTKQGVLERVIKSSDWYYVRRNDDFHLAFQTDVFSDDEGAKAMQVLVSTDVDGFRVRAKLWKVDRAETARVCELVMAVAYHTIPCFAFGWDPADGRICVQRVCPDGDLSPASLTVAILSIINLAEALTPAMQKILEGEAPPSNAAVEIAANQAVADIRSMLDQMRALLAIAEKAPTTDMANPALMN